VRRGRSSRCNVNCKARWTGRLSGCLLACETAPRPPTPTKIVLGPRRALGFFVTGASQQTKQVDSVVWNIGCPSRWHICGQGQDAAAESYVEGGSVGDRLCVLRAMSMALKASLASQWR